MNEEKQSEMNSYDRQALVEIAEFKQSEVGRLGKLANALHAPVDRAGNKAFDTKLGAQVEKALTKAIESVRGAATWSVREDAILEDFRDDGHEVRGFDDIRELELEQVEDVIGHLARKYRVLAMAEGTAVGAVGALGIAADIPLVLGLAMRGTIEFAAYYGFYPSSDVEKAYVLDLVAAASAPTPQSRQESLQKLTAISTDLSTPRAAGTSTLVAMQAAEQLVESIVTRMARGKFAQSVPLLGSLIGGGFNRWFVGQVMETASTMYRERFLVRRYGIAPVPVTSPVAPA